MQETGLNQVHSLIFPLHINTANVRAHTHNTFLTLPESAQILSRPFTNWQR